MEKRSFVKGKEKAGVCFSAVVLLILLILSIVLVNTRAAKDTPKDHLQKITASIWDIVYTNEEEKSDNLLILEDQKPREEKKRTITAEVIPYDGVVRSISCWGDSMMYGCATTPGFITLNGITRNISYTTTPDMLSEFTGLQTYNLGVNGETSKDIATRAGGLMMVTDRDIVIEGTGIAEFKLQSIYDGDNIYMDDYSGYNFQSNQTNICVINGEKYYVTNSSDGESQIIYGTDVDIKEGTFVFTLAAVERKNDILILEMGSNAGWYNDYDELIAQYDSILESTGCKYYIIVGDTDDPELSADMNKIYIGQGETPWEQALSKAYGEHFINMRLYMIQNGLSDCGLEATEEDLEGFTRGEISQQLRADWTHFNSYGYYAKAKGIYEKGVELGYWQEILEE